jgi:hypothetical protein
MSDDNEMTWVQLNEELQNATEAQCLELMDYEASTGKRANYMLRIHSRFNKVRAERERLEIIKNYIPPKKAPPRVKKPKEGYRAAS